MPRCNGLGAVAVVALTLAAAPRAEAVNIVSTDLGNTFNAAITPAVSFGNHGGVLKVNVYGVKTNGVVTVNQVDAKTKAVTGWTDLPGATTSSAPAAVQWDNHREVFIVSGGVLKHAISTNNSTFGAWAPLSGGPGGICSGLSAVSWGPGRVDVFMVGCDHALWHIAGINNTFNWALRGKTTLVGAPSAVSPAGARLDVWVRDGQGTLWDDQYNGDVWTWRDAGVGVVVGSGAAAIRPVLDTFSAVGVGLANNFGQLQWAAAVGDVFPAHAWLHSSLGVNASAATNPHVVVESEDLAMVYWLDARRYVRTRLNLEPGPSWATPSQGLIDNNLFFASEPAVVFPIADGFNFIYVFGVTPQGNMLFVLDNSN